MSSSAEWRKPRSGSTSPSGSSPRSGTASGSRGRTDGYGRHPDRHPHFRGRRVHRDGLLADRSRRGRPDPRQERLDRWRRSAHRARGTEGYARSGARGRAARGGGARRAHGLRRTAARAEPRGPADRTGQMSGDGGTDGNPDPHHRRRGVLRERDRVHPEQDLPGEAQGADPGAKRDRAGRGAGGGGRAAARSGGTRGAGRFYGALAGQGAGRGGGETGPRGKAYGVYVMQFPPFPPGQPDLNYVIHQLTPFAVLILMFMGVRWVLRSPVGEALAERIRHRTPGRWAVAGEDPQRVAALEEQVAHLQIGRA